MIERKAVEQEKALLVGVIQPGMTAAVIQEHLDELELLANTAGAEVMGRVTQAVSRINPATFIGKGKAKQLINQATELGVKLILFDDELSPAQIKNYHQQSEHTKVLDRSGLILDIFQKHARTKEATTQVDLAYLEYLLPRLTRQWTHLERQMGGIGTRAGMGEAQIEVDRRRVRTRRRSDARRCFDVRPVDLAEEVSRDPQDVLWFLEVRSVAGSADQRRARIGQPARQVDRDGAELRGELAGDQADRCPQIRQVRVERWLRARPHASKTVGEPERALLQAFGARGGQCEVCPGHLPFLEADDDVHKAARSSRLQGHHHR